MGRFRGIFSLPTSKQEGLPTLRHAQAHNRQEEISTDYLLYLPVARSTFAEVPCLGTVSTRVVRAADAVTMSSGSSGAQSNGAVGILEQSGPRLNVARSERYQLFSSDWRLLGSKLLLVRSEVNACMISLPASPHAPVITMSKEHGKSQKSVAREDLL